MHKNELSPGPGKTAPRLLRDLLDYDVRYNATGRNLLVDPPPQFKAVGHPPRTGPSDCRHQLCKKESQSTCPRPNEEPDNATKYEVASYCSKCRYHFLLTVDFRDWKDGQTPCNLRDPVNPLHHFRVVDSKTSKGTGNKYDTYIEAHQFVCTGDMCPVTVEVKLSPPRIPNDLLALITDRRIVAARGQRVIKAEPERFSGYRTLLPIQVLSNLRTYLQDARTTTGERKRIDARNKKFILGLADDCNELVKYLDFTSSTEESAQPGGDPTFYWNLPIVNDRNRNFIDDAQFELAQQICDRPEDERREANQSVSYTPTLALIDIRRSLSFNDYPKKSRNVENLEAVEHPHYASLGALELFTDTLISWAYDRQCECDPSNKPYYLDCLRDISTGRNSTDLQTKVAVIVSNGEVSLNEINQAYLFFRLNRDNTEGDDHIIGVYKSRIDSAPRQKDEARDCLLTIAKDRNSKAIEAVANDRSMTFQEALEYLNVSSDTASDSIEASAVAMSFEGDKSKVGRALRAIANKRGNDYTLQRAAINMESGTAESNLDVGEAYNRLQINDRSAPDDTVLAYYQSLSNGAPAGSSDSYTEAFRVIAHDRQSSYLLRKLDDPLADVQAERSTASQPVGLDNIGNTCYLNSLLQYYYTVKAVREVVMNFQHNRMSLSDDDIKKKRVGGRAVGKGEIIKAQKFVDELHRLFENLKTASTRSIKPTRELAELTIFSSAAEANFRRASISSPSGPPNLTPFSSYPVFGPEGPPVLPYFPPPPTCPDDDIEMIDRPGEKDTEQGDDSSEGTLVDMDPVLDTSAMAEMGKDAKVEDTSGPFDDAVMVNGDNVSPTSEPILAAPDKPPPIPPRNKAGLSIQTNEHKDVITDDDLWKFGSQQDVTEVIGNVMFRLQCAIKPTSIDPVSGEQIDSVRDTFYGANASYIKKSQKLERKIEPWANLIVFPDENKSRDIYEALDVVFDEQQVSVDGAYQPQYASITKLPPILQIQIQRTRYDNVKHTAYKNRNAVVFPETIYLDRYMDSEDPESALMRRRQDSWKWKSQIHALEERQKALGEEGRNVEELTVPNALTAAVEITKNLQEIEDIDIDPSLPEMIEERLNQINQEIESNNEQIRQLKQKRNEQFTNMRQYEYKLQTVFIHRGEAGGGHYWIYIYDFENDIWREYNDEYVTEVKDRRKIFEHNAGGLGGTPYYLGYVRSADVTDLVGAVHREVKEIDMPDETMTNTNSSWANQLEDDVAIDDEEKSGARHIEHVEPRAILPKTDWGNKSGAGAQWHDNDQQVLARKHGW